MKSIQIPSDKYGQDLLGYLFRQAGPCKDSKIIELLHRICLCHLTALYNSGTLITDLVLSEDEKQIIIEADLEKSDNIEIKARINDLLTRFDKDKRIRTDKVSNAYLTLYQETQTIDYLIRAIASRNIKSLNDASFLQKISDLFKGDKNIHPNWLKTIIELLKKSYSLEVCKNEYSDYFVRLAETFHKNAEYDKERTCNGILFSLKAISVEKLKLEDALSFEAEADEINRNKVPNTSYPSLVGLYQDAYNKIVSIKSRHPEIHDRIRGKLIVEKKIFRDFIASFGVPLIPKTPKDFHIEQDSFFEVRKMDNLKEAIAILKDIPIISKIEVQSYMSSAALKGSFINHMSSSIRLDTKGNHIGTETADASTRTFAHMYYRNMRQDSISKFFEKFDEACICVKYEDLYRELTDGQFDILPKDRLSLFAIGLYYGFNRDYISASHILMPQIEHGLLCFIENYYDKPFSKLDKQNQEEPILSNILDHLKPIVTDEALFFEIHSFLESRTDVNFRNKLSHGLFSESEIDAHGMYFWWLTIKLLYCFHENITPKRAMN